MILALDTQPVAPAAIGLLLGMRHALDADHLVAVSTILSRQQGLRRAALVGALWGVGHTITILLVGGALVLLQLSVPPRLGLAFEFLVAVMLLVLGFRNVADARRGHVHQPPDPRRPLYVGLVHGLAGSAAIALLVVTLVPSRAWALVYLLLFGLGTVLGMMTVTVLLGVPAGWAVSRLTDAGMLQRARLGLAIGAGVVSVAFGLYLGRELLAAGLLSGAPTWVPR